MRRYTICRVSCSGANFGDAAALSARLACLDEPHSNRDEPVVRTGHELSKGRITAARYAAGRHVIVSRRGLEGGPVDEALESLGLKRKIVAIVGGFAAALALARGSELIATVPEGHTGNLRAGMHTFPLPVATPQITVSLFWHPRLDNDPAHRWLRGLVREVCG